MPSKSLKRKKLPNNAREPEHTLIECEKCHRKFPPYWFVDVRDERSKMPKLSFCWECESDHECIVCHELKDYTHFRVQGKICNECKAKMVTIKTVKRDR